VSAAEGVAGSATRRLDHTMAAAVGASRVFALAQTVAITWSVRRRVRHPRVLAFGVAGLAAQSAWATGRGWRRGSIRDRAVASSDAVAQCAALAVEAASWGSRAIPAQARWSETLGAVLTSWLPFEDPSPRATASSLLGWLGTYAIVTSGGSQPGMNVTAQRINEATGHATLTMAGRALGLQLVAQAAELDAARSEAVEQAERLAAARERHHQQRIVHDSALQILETIAGGWDVDDAFLAGRIDYEIARLERLLGEPALDGHGLAEALSGLVSKFALMGLHVDLDVSELRGPSPEICNEALVGATHEALTNVFKHAGVKQARVRAASGDPGITISIADDGRGFNPETRHHGFGLDESIRGRMHDIQGTAKVSSAPCHGTLVELRAPR
jgi:signal transduction histidine kinase